MWKLPVLIALTSLALAILGVLGTQFILLQIGVPEAVTNALALVVGLGAIVLAEWRVRRWWVQRH